MAISFVASRIWSSTVSNNQIVSGMPPGIQVGDLILSGYGNVGNEAGNACTPAAGWTTIQESLAASNVYFVILGKIATSTEVDAEDTDIQIATYGNGTSGQSLRSSASVAYRGTASTIGTAVVASNHKHESAPADETIETNSATSTASTQWYVFFYNMGGAGNQTADTFSTDAGTIREQRSASNASVNSAIAAGDSNGTIAVQSHQRSGTWSNNSTRLNGGIVVIEQATEAGLSTARGVIVDRQALSRASFW